MARWCRHSGQKRMLKKPIVKAHWVEQKWYWILKFKGMWGVWLKKAIWEIEMLFYELYGAFVTPTIVHKNCETAILSHFNIMPIYRLMHGTERNSTKSSKTIRQRSHSKN